MAPMPARERVYFDHNATSPLDPRVLEAMLPWLGTRHGNPSSIHREGQEAHGAVEEARRQVADLLGAQPPELVFAASGSEANNAVMAHVARRSSHRGHLVSTAMEHPSILESLIRLEEAGMEATRVPPTPLGAVDPAEIAAAIRPDTRLVSVMLANNELGTVQPVAEIAAHCRQIGVPILCDAVQAVGKIPVRVDELGVDYLVLAGHKFHGPFGAAALWIRSGVEFSGLIVGGGQERRRRASTENVPAIVGLGATCRLAGEELADRYRLLSGLRDAFEEGVRRIDGAIVHCVEAERLPHTSHVALLGTTGEALMIRLDIEGFAVSTGSACASGALEPSPTLLALGLSHDEALASLRISFGITNTIDQVRQFLPVLAAQVGALRELVPGGSAGRGTRSA